MIKLVPRRITLVFFLLILGRAVFSDPYFSTGNDGVFQRFTVADGLAQSTGQDILVDSKGRLWIGTQDGLDCYDGKGFKHYRPLLRNETSLPDTTIISLFEDKSGVVWVGTLGGGAGFYRPATDDFIRFSAGNDENSLYDKEIRDFAETEDGRLWIATASGLNVLSSDRSSLSRVTSTAGIYIERILTGPKGQLWLGTKNGLAFITAEGSVQYFKAPEGKFINELIRWDESTLLLVSDYKNIFYFYLTTGEFKPYNKLDKILAGATIIEHLLRDSKGNLWIGTYDRGLFRDDGPENLIRHFTYNPEDYRSLSSNAVRRIREDRRGTIWIGTYFNGVSVFAYELQRFHIARHDPSNQDSILDNTVRGFYLDAPTGALWVATSKGMNRWLPKEGRYKRYSGEYGNFPKEISGSVRGLYRSPDGRLFVFSFNGIAVFEPKADHFIAYELRGILHPQYQGEKALALHIDRHGNEWIGTKDSLYLLFSGKNTWERFSKDTNDPASLMGNYITRFFEDSQGRVWISTSSGISLWTPGVTGFRNFKYDEKDPAGLGSDNVFSFYEAADAFWLGCQGGGLVRMEKDFSASRIYTTFDGLPNNTIYSILPDRFGFLWISTNRGIARIDPKTMKVTAFDEQDGIQSQEFNNFAYWQSREGLIFMGGIAGFNYFDPNLEQKPAPASKVVLSEARIRSNGRSISCCLSSGKPVNLAWAERDISFTFYSLDFAAGKRIQYTTKLEGYDKDWSRLGNKNTIDYTNLPDGHYVLHIKASDMYGSWNSEEAVFYFQVMPPWWKTWPAFIAYILVLAALIFGIVRIALRVQNNARLRLIKENQRLEELVAKRTADLVEANHQLENLATHDKLTGLLNRRRMDELITDEIGRSGRYKKPFCFIIGDIDHFKNINDTRGHQFGDQVLTATAVALTKGLRSSDSFGRWGGEEFVVLLPETNLADGQMIAERLRILMEEAAANTNYPVTMSFGIVEFALGDTAETIVQRADEALYAAKAGGRNRVETKGKKERVS